MVDIRPNVLPDAILPLRTGDALIVDQGTDGVRQASPFDITDSVSPVASQAEAQAGTDNVKRMTSLRTKQSIASEVGVTLASNAQGAKADSAVQSVNGKTGNAVSLVKSDIGLGNVDNTSDANKPISTATQTALNAKANSAITITAGAGLIGGGDLTADRTVSLNASSVASLAKADSSVQTVNGVPPTAGNVDVSAEEVRLQDSRSSAILESFAGSVNFVQTAGYYTAGDGGGALYKRVVSEPTHAGKFQSSDGAWWELVAAEANPRQFGGVPNTGVVQDTAIQGAWGYAKAKGIPIFVPSGVWTIATQIKVYTYFSLRGEGGARKTIVRLADNSNITMLYGETTDANWDTNPVANGEYEGDNFWDIQDITFDGNRDNNLTAGGGIRVWGRRWSIRNVVFQNMRHSGMATKFSDGTSPLGMEARVDNVIIDNVGTDGWYFDGPHDSTINGLIVIDPSQNADNTFSALNVLSGGNGRFFGFHAWHRSWAPNRMKAAFNQSSGGGSCSFDNSHFEGAMGANVDLNGQPCQFGPTCMFYAAWNGKNIILGTGSHIIMGVLAGPGSGRPDCKGIELGWDAGHKSGRNLINVKCIDQRAGAIDFTHSDGANIITVTGYNGAGVKQVGTPTGTDIVNLIISGGGGGRTYTNPTW